MQDPPDNNEPPKGDPPPLIIPPGAAPAHFAGEAAAEAREAMSRSKGGATHVEDMGKLTLLLEAAIGAVPRPPAFGKDSLDLLNLACGHCEEAATLGSFFGGGGGREVRQFAVDLRGHKIEEAQRRYAKTESAFASHGLPTLRAQGATVEFVADDATHLVGYGQIPESFDIIFIRHQNLWHDRAVWKKIYEFALARIADEDGLLIITSYFTREHVLALNLLRELGGRVLANLENPASRPLDYPGKTVDRHLAAISRGGGAF